jgi:hypothetical protein
MKALETNRYFPAFTALNHKLIVREGQIGVSYKNFPFVAKCCNVRSHCVFAESLFSTD